MFCFLVLAMDPALKSRVSEDDVVLLDNGAGDSLVIHKHGATVLSWKISGEEILFLSKQAVLDGTKAIRGGIPLVFPQFGPWSCGPQHGFARIKRWNLETAPVKTGDGSSTCSLSLEDDEETRKMWDYRFKLVCTLTLDKSSLIMSLSVNNTGEKSFDFTTLMHTYFATLDIDRTVIKGLQNLSYIDKVKGSSEFTEDRAQVVIPENYDRVYKKCPGTVTLETEKHTTVIQLNNFPDVGESFESKRYIVENHSLLLFVVWNPWEEKAKGMSDFGDEEYKFMVCVEAGSVSAPVTITPGQVLVFSQTVNIQSRR